MTQDQQAKIRALKQLLADAETRLSEAMVCMDGAFVLTLHANVRIPTLLQFNIVAAIYCVCWQAAAQAEADEREAAHEDAVSALREQLAAEATRLQDLAVKAADDATAHAAATVKLDSELNDAKLLASEATQELQTLHAKACFLLMLCTSV